MYNDDIGEKYGCPTGLVLGIAIIFIVGFIIRLAVEMIWDILN
jgi:hypothetical protein